MISIGNLQINKLFLGNLEVAKAYLGDVEVYGSTKKYMTMTVLDGDAGTTIAPTITGTLSPNLQYRVNNGSWNDFIVGTTADIQVVAGDVVQWKGINESGISTSSSNYLNFAISGNPVSLSGNVMSLIDGVGDALVIPNNYCFYRLFHGSSIKTVSPDFLPATTLTNGCYFDLFSNSLLENAPELHALTMQENCYRGMFYGCQHFTQAPELPATTLANGCYAFMLAECSSLVQVTALPATELAPECYRGIFQGCTALTQAPALPATELAQGCYRQMFYWCSSLVNAPELPATTLSDYCYQYMFYGCSSLNYVKSLATNITATNALNQWLSGVAATGTFVKKYGVSYPTGISGIPSGWTVVEERPKPEGKYMTITIDDSAGATTISTTVVSGTLNPNLQYRINSNGDWTDFIVGTTSITAKPGDWVQFKGNNPDGLSNNKNYFKFNISGLCHLSGNVMSLIDGIGETKVIPNEYCFRILFADSNVKTVSSDFLPATTLANNCYYFMFNSCKSLVTAPALPATTLANNCYSHMFYGCTSLTQAPVLPATTLAGYCYQYMFYGCTSLTQAPELPATTLADSCYFWMFYGCTSLVNVPEILPATTLADSCYQSMFRGCTSLATAPELPATTLYGRCYGFMFQDCSKLSYVKSLATTGTLNDKGGVSSNLTDWLMNVSSSGKFVKKKGVKWWNGDAGIPRSWTVEEI